MTCAAACARISIKDGQQEESEPSISFESPGLTLTARSQKDFVVNTRIAQVPQIPGSHDCLYCNLNVEWVPDAGHERNCKGLFALHQTPPLFACSWLMPSAGFPVCGRHVTCTICLSCLYLTLIRLDLAHLGCISAWYGYNGV